MPEKPNKTLETFDTLSADLRRQGVELVEANSLAWLEAQVQNWPAAWGDELRVLVYGDFDPPQEDQVFSDLGITVYKEKQKKTHFSRNAWCVLRATVTVREKSVAALLDAARRVNVLLGCFVLIQWGNCGCGWWSHLTHGTGGGASWSRVASSDWMTAISSVLRMPPSVRRPIDAALYWFRSARALTSDSQRGELIRHYAALWNAFECLVEAVNVLRPMNKLSKTQKQRRIDTFLGERKGQLTPADVDQLYRDIVNPGLVGQASHALGIVFGQSDGEYYTRQCFKLTDKSRRLYGIRNAINHGTIDAENPKEMARVESRLGVLQILVLGMFGRLVRFPCPVDPDLPSQAKKAAR